MVDFDELQATARHGTRARYKAGCACDDCRWANTAYHRDLRERKRDQMRLHRPLASITPVRPASLVDDEPEEDYDDEEEQEDRYEPVEPIDPERIFGAVEGLRSMVTLLRSGKGTPRVIPQSRRPSGVIPRRTPPRALPGAFTPVGHRLRLSCGHIDRAAIPPGAVIGRWQIACTMCSAAASTAVMRRVVEVMAPS